MSASGTAGQVRVCGRLGARGANTLPWPVISVTTVLLECLLEPRRHTEPFARSAPSNRHFVADLDVV